MIGDVTAPVGLHELGTDGGGIDQHVLTSRSHAQRVHVRVLEKEQVVVDGPREQRVLQRVGVAVPDPPEPADAEHYSSVRQSRVSRISFTLATNAAA